MRALKERLPLRRYMIGMSCFSRSSFAGADIE
jgi:hypothetical protein